jgi:Invasin, domain 3
MLRNVRRGAGRRFLPRFAALLLAMALLPAAAQASQVGTVSVEACVGEGGCVQTQQVRVDQQFGLIVKFHVTNALGPGNHIYVEGPEGFVFASDIQNTQIDYNGGGYSDGGRSTFNGGRALDLKIAGFGPTVSAGGALELDIALFENKLTTPPHPGEMHFKVWTTTDSEARESSNAITTTVGEPATLTPVTSSIAGTVGQAFAEQPEVELLDSRGNPISGKTITFEAPEAEPSGAFTGGLTSSTGTTDSNGLASPSISLQAGTVAGEWSLAVSGPNATSSSIPATNLAGPAEEVEISLEPSTLPADESSTSEATITVKDQYGNKITGDEVEIDTAGGPSATTPALQGNGTFTSELTASRVPGEYTITATDTTAGIFESTTLTQTTLPATNVELTLEPASVIADPLEKATAVATVTDALGQPVSGDEVAFESPYTEGVQPPVDNGDGTYSWTVPVTAVPGEYEITAVDESVEPSISDSATLIQKPKASGGGPSVIPPPAATPPVAKIDGGPKGVVHRARVRFHFSAPGAASFQCRLDGSGWKRCSSPATFAVAPGRHVFQVRALSASGAAGPVAKRTFKRAPKQRHHHRKGGGGR